MRMRFLNFAAVAVLMLSTASSVLQAGVITFDANVAMNFSALSAGSDQNPINAIDFGSASLPGTARVAYNGTDVNGNGVLDTGDTARIVGHGLIDTFNGQGVANNSFFAQLRNINGTVNSVGQTIFEQGNYLDGTGLLDLYVKVAPGFSVFNASTSDNGVLAATFRLTGGMISPLGGPVFTNNGLVSGTNLFAELVYNNNGFLSTTSGDAFVPGSLTAYTNITTTDRGVLANTPGNTQSLTNINGTNYSPGRDYSGSDSLLDIGAGFNPQLGEFNTSSRPFDLVLSVDGNAAFATVPEPASLMIFGAIGVACLVHRRRTVKKN